MINSNMNSVTNIETLDNNLWQVVAKHFGITPYLFQDDNAPCHRSRVVEEWKRQDQLQYSWRHTLILIDKFSRYSSMSFFYTSKSLKSKYAHFLLCNTNRCIYLPVDHLWNQQDTTDQVFYGLAMINGNMNSVTYIETPDNNLWQVVAKHFGNTPRLLQDDNESESIRPT
jgi:hypothetical protein